MRPEALAAGDRGRPARRAGARASSAPRWARPPPTPSTRVRAIGEICREQGLWLHVDAAMAGTAALCPEFRHIHDGLGAGRQLLLQPPQVDVHELRLRLLLRRGPARALIRALSILPEYLRNKATESGAVIDYRDWHVPARPALPRAQAVVRDPPLRGRGAAPPRAPPRGARAGLRPLGPRRTADFELAAPAPLNLVCFRHRGGDAVNQQTPGPPEPERRSVPHPHPARRPAHAAAVRRPDPHRAAPRGPSLGPDPGGGGGPGRAPFGVAPSRAVAPAGGSHHAPRQLGGPRGAPSGSPGRRTSSTARGCAAPRPSPRRPWPSARAGDRVAPLGVGAGRPPGTRLPLPRRARTPWVLHALRLRARLGPGASEPTGGRARRDVARSGPRRGGDGRSARGGAVPARVRCPPLS